MPFSHGFASPSLGARSSHEHGEGVLHSVSMSAATSVAAARVAAAAAITPSPATAIATTRETLRPQGELHTSKPRLFILPLDAHHSVLQSTSRKLKCNPCCNCWHSSVLVIAFGRAWSSTPGARRVPVLAVLPQAAWRRPGSSISSGALSTPGIATRHHTLTRFFQLLACSICFTPHTLISRPHCTR